MDLRHLRTMLAVMEEGTIGKAAERLHISQPALTKSIQRLEQELGVRLFERKARGMVATPFAESLRAYAQSACIGMAQAIKELNALKEGTEGAITIAAPPLITTGSCPTFWSVYLQNGQTFNCVSCRKTTTCTRRCWRVTAISSSPCFTKNISRSV